MAFHVHYYVWYHVVKQEQPTWRRVSERHRPVVVLVGVLCAAPPPAVVGPYGRALNTAAVTVETFTSSPEPVVH